MIYDIINCKREKHFLVVKNFKRVIEYIPLLGEMLNKKNHELKK